MIFSMILGAFIGYSLWYLFVFKIWPHIKVRIKKLFEEIVK